MTKKALIWVDIQNDFLPGGALAVPDGHAVVPVANRLARELDVDLVVATQDWHPVGHGSFATSHTGHTPGELIDLNGLEQILWPDHCVQGTEGSLFAAGLDTEAIVRVFPKGTDPGIDSYSGFHDNGHRQSTGLAEWLGDQGVTEVFILGLATDYCVKFTALDAVQEGFVTTVILDGCRAVNLSPGDGDAAVDDMREAGVSAVSSTEVTTA